MKKTVFVVLIAFALTCGACLAVEFRRAETLDDAHSASCRVSVANARGTGAFIGVDTENNRALILTNYHVVTSNSRATLDFWTNGVRESISGTVEARFYDASIPYDFAIISVDPDELKRIDPPYIALGGRDAAPDANSYILSSGCPKGRFAQAWKGKVLGYYNGSTVMFQPGPVPGQSGSAIISDIDGELWVTGVLTWLIGTEGADDSKGGAIPIANLYKAIQGRQSATGHKNDASPIPPNATECAEKAPYVLEFTQDNCPPCETAKTDAKKIKDAGIELRLYNLSGSPQGVELAKKYGVQGTPTFVICKEDGSEVTRYTGSGKGTQIINDVIALTPTPEPEPEIVEVEPPKEEEPADEWLCYSDVLTDRFEDVDEDFRNRAPVYDYADAGFFDDSNDRWNNRGRKIAPPKIEEKPKQEPAPKLREKLFGEQERGFISGTIDGAVKKIEKRFAEKCDEKQREIENKLTSAYKAWRWKFGFALLCIVIFGVCVSEFVKKSCATLWELIKQAFILEDDEPEPEPEKPAEEPKTTTRRKTTEEKQ